MSAEDLEIMRRGYESFIATGELVDPQFVWDMSTFRGWPERQAYEGSEGVPGGLGRGLGRLDARDRGVSRGWRPGRGDR
jgi:hypothetical protein